jgi:hypothetical protein
MKRILLILALAVTASSWASAAPLTVRVQFPQGLIPDKETTFTATVEGAGLDAVRGAPLSIVFDSRQNSIPQQVELGKIGDKLEGKVILPTGIYRMTARFNINGRNYAVVADDSLPPLPLPNGDFCCLKLETNDPNSSFRLPVALLGWFAGAIVLGLVALRSKQFLF